MHGIQIAKNLGDIVSGFSQVESDDGGAGIQ
jgi:hypothetical protein